MREPRYFRCQTCNQLTTDRQIITGKHAGHKLMYAQHVTFWEWLMVRLFLIR